MRARDIIEEVKEATGLCSTQANLRVISRAVELLANEGLFDPLLGYLNLATSGSNYIALPREVKTPLRINIDNNPAFSRSRLFEFTLNTNGSEEGDRIDWSWDDRGHTPIQDEKKLPGRLAYKCQSEDDAGKTITIIGRDSTGRQVNETLNASVSAPVKSTSVFHEVLHVFRDETIEECFLVCGDNEELIGQYYADETEPNYRVIRLSKSVANVRMLFRRDILDIKTLDDFIPLHSELAVIHAAKAVRLYNQDEYDKGDAALGRAVAFIKKEQEARDEAATLAQAMESPTATDSTINCRDGIIASDVYDDASEIFGPVGRRKLFDNITTAIEILSNKATWDSREGIVDIVTSNAGDGTFVLPRFVETPISINIEGRPSFPRNRWFEFHLNGTGSSESSTPGTWDDLGETCLINRLPVENGKVVPTKIVLIPENSLDEGKEAWAYGIERLSDGREVEVYRNGRRGWRIPCTTDTYNPGSDAPAFVRIDRITKAETTGFTRLAGYIAPSTNIALVGDMGRSDSKAAAVASMIEKKKASDVILLGDNNYGYQINWVYRGSIGLANISTNMILAAIADESNVFQVGDEIRIGTEEVTVLNVEPGPETYYRYLTISRTISVELSALISRREVTSWASTIDVNLTSNYGDWKDSGNLWPVPGNHDWGDVSNNPNGLADYFAYFDFLEGKAYYTRTFGDVQVFFLDSDDNEPDGNTIGSVQHQWFIGELEKSTARWKVVCFHHTIRTSSTSHAANEKMKWGFNTLGVDAVVMGHNHVYERWEENGVLFLTVGTGSGSLNSFTSDRPSGSKYRVSTSGALFMEASVHSLKFTFRNKDGTKLDERELVKPAEVEADVVLGYYYPDEVEPKYRAIKLATTKAANIRVLFRKRTAKITSLHEPIPLRSRQAIKNMMRAMRVQESDPASAELFEQKALQYLSEERINSAPSDTPIFQFEDSVMPGHTFNIT